MRDSQMAKRKKGLNEKLAVQSLKVGTQNADMQEEDDDLNYVASIGLEADGMPSRDELLKSLGYKGMNIASHTQSDGKYDDIINGIGMFNWGSGLKKPARLKLCD